MYKYRCISPQRYRDTETQRHTVGIGTWRAKHSHKRSDIKNIATNEETNIATNEETQRHKRQKRREKYSHERKDTDIQRHRDRL